MPTVATPAQVRTVSTLKDGRVVSSACSRAGVALGNGSFPRRVSDGGVKSPLVEVTMDKPRGSRDGRTV